MSDETPMWIEYTRENLGTSRLALDIGRRAGDGGGRFVVPNRDLSRCGTWGTADKRAQGSPRSSGEAKCVVPIVDAPFTRCVSNSLGNAVAQYFATFRNSLDRLSWNLREAGGSADG